MPNVARNQYSSVCWFDGSLKMLSSAACAAGELASGWLVVMAWNSRRTRIRGDHKASTDTTKMMSQSSPEAMSRSQGAARAGSRRACLPGWPYPGLPGRRMP